MKTDVVIAGVGGQGVLTAAALLGEAGLRDGLTVRQGELHGMSQRGGAVQATLRLADGPLAGDLVAEGRADLVLGLEPLEALRCLPYLAPDGMLVSSSEPHDDLPGYPPVAELLARIEELPAALLVDATELARSVKSPRSANVVLIGAALPRLPLAPDTVAACIRELFTSRGDKVVERNLAALRAGLSVAAPQ